jgi:polyisoprenoid-binding protein YceI
MRTPEWFAMDAFPEAVFESHKIEKIDDRHFVAQGSLQIKGRVRTISLPFAWDRNEGNAVMAGQVDLRRDWFGIGSGEWASDDPIALNVKVTYHVTWRPDD